MKFSLYNGFTQVICTAFICFCCPGFFNALSGLGGAGSHDSTSSAAANAALYAMLAIFGYFGGAFFALFGARILMCIGGLTYAFYAGAAYISGIYSGYNWLFILAGATLGIGASFVWVSQGALMLAYAPEGSTGKYISTFWTIFNMGGLLGGIIQFALNYNQNSEDASAASYMVFVGVMVAGSIFAAFFIVDPSKVVKEDGTQVVVHPPRSPREEFGAVASVIFDRNMMLLFVLFFGSNFFYTYQFDGVNGFMFNLRTRGLNASLYWAAQMLGAVCIGKILDNKQYNIGKRALTGFTVLAVAINIVYALGCYMEYDILAGLNKNNPMDPKMDFTESRFVFPCIVFILYGLGDSMIQAYAYWLMRIIARTDTQLCARYTGFYKGAQSFGAAISWMLDIKQFGIPYIFQFWCCWLLFVAALPSVLMVVNRIRKQEDEDFKPSVETDSVVTAARASPSRE
jgi:MFS family permease